MVSDKIEDKCVQLLVVRTRYTNELNGTKQKKNSKPPNATQ